MDKLPLDARLLSNAVIELNIARHILALYSREHQLVQLSLDKTFAILAELFELRPEITLAVAKDTLIVDGRPLDPKNPVYREFALSLSRVSVATLTFVKGVTREEVCDFFRFLAGDTAGISAATLPQILAEYQLRHILIEPLDYRAFGFAEDSTKKDDSDEYLLERYIKALLAGDLPTDGVQAVVENVEPGTLAMLMNQAGSEITREASYDTVVSSYLRGGAGKPVSGGDLQRLLTFIAGLRPEFKQQFLSSSVQAISRDPAALNQALEGVSVDSIIEFVTQIDRTHVALPAELGTLIARFSGPASNFPAVVSTSTTCCSPRRSRVSSRRMKATSTARSPIRRRSAKSSRRNRRSPRARTVRSSRTNWTMTMSATAMSTPCSPFWTPPCRE